MPATDQRRTYLLAAVLVAAVVLAYGNSLTGPFIFDDFQAVARNSSIRELARLDRVLSPPLDAAGSTGRPLVNLTFALNYAFGGLDVRGYHAASILLHALGALALFGLLRRTFQLPVLAPRWAANGTERALGMALLWAVHPLLTESVVCIAQRNEVLAGLFYLLSLYGFARAAGHAPAARGWLAASVAACGLGVASKEVVATAPVLVLLYDRTFVAGSFAAAWRARWKYYLSLAATWLLLAWLMRGTNQRNGIVGFGLGMGAWEYLVSQGHAIAVYLKLALWPHPLVVDYGHALFPLREIWPQFLLIAVLVAATAWALWRRPRWGFAGAWFFVILGPSSSIVPLTTQTMAEHRMYLPLAIIATGMVLALEALWPRRWMGLCAALAAGAAIITIQRNAEYLDELGLWQATLRQQPRNARIHAHLGDYHRRHQEWAAAAAAFRRATELREGFALAHSELGSMLLELGRVPDSLEQHRIALRLRPDLPEIQYNFGVAAAKAGDLPAAVRAWQEALRLKPDMTVAMLRLAEQSLQEGDRAAAFARYELALRENPRDAELLDGWGRILTATGRLDEAISVLTKARDLRPDMPQVHYNLGNALLSAKRFDEAAASYAEALRRQPAFPAAQHNLALVHLERDRVGEAVTLLQAAVAGDPQSVEFRLTLAYALAREGRDAEALAHALQARSLDPNSARAAALVEQLQRR
ncbi:MAG TPA: tetratricopeptide repeat protein [Lacunisphaera sp.]|nr:tetratricopeptide repeat protein [Lacunisphaera sp.]